MPSPADAPQTCQRHRRSRPRLGCAIRPLAELASHVLRR